MTTGSSLDGNPHVRLDGMAMPGSGALFRKTVAFAMGLFLSTGVCAIEYRWGGGSTAGSWTDPLNWTPATDYPKAGDMAIFDSPATFTQDFAVGAGVLAISNATSATLTFDCSISGEGGISKFGDGELHLKKANPFAGKFVARGIRDFAVDTTLSGQVYIYNGGAMGNNAAEFDQDYEAGHGCRLNIMGPMTIRIPVSLTGDQRQQSNVCYNNLAGGSVVFEGLVYCPYRYLDAFDSTDASGVIRFSGGLRIEKNWLYMTGRSNIDYYIENSLYCAATARQASSSRLHLGAFSADNNFAVWDFYGHVICEGQDVLKSAYSNYARINF